MKGFIEVTQIDKDKNTYKTLVAVKAIMYVEEHKNSLAIIFDVSSSMTRKYLLNEHIFVSETFAEVLKKIREAIE